jgi:DNA-binding MarR family transcriptional regulator
MRALPQSQLHPEDEKIGRFLEFMREVSPEADPTSVLLFGQLLRADHRLIQAAEKQLGTAGLSWAKFRLLVDLFRHEDHGAAGGMQPSDLSEMQGICRNTVSSLIASLEKDGLISRELHRTDRRKFVIRLTPQGHRVLKSKLASQLIFVTDCFGAFSASERQNLLKLLTRLNQSLSTKGK